MNIPEYQQLPISEKIKLQAHGNFEAYCRTIDPLFESPPHIQSICSTLQSAEEKIFNRVMIRMPPRHGKSHSASKKFPAWFMGRHPGAQVIHVSYGQTTTQDFSEGVLEHLKNPVHQFIFPECQVKSAQVSRKITTTKGGNYFVSSIDGAMVGRGANCFLIDDPYKGREQAESQAWNRRVINTYRGGAYTRLMGPDSIVILIMTSWRYDDLSGFILENEGKIEEGGDWFVLDMPAIAEEDEPFTGRKKGEALWPARFPLPYLHKVRQAIGAYEFSAQYQQKPTPEGGGIMDIRRFQRYEAIPNIAEYRRVILSIDTALSESEAACDSAIEVFGERQDFVSDLIFAWAMNVGYAKLKAVTLSFYYIYRPTVVLIEYKGSGISLCQDLEALGLPVVPVTPTVGKKIRARDAMDYISTGYVRIPVNARVPGAQGWLNDFENQVIQFGLRDDKNDMVDALTQYVDYCKKRGVPMFNLHTINAKLQSQVQQPVAIYDVNMQNGQFILCDNTNGPMWVYEEPKRGQQYVIGAVEKQCPIGRDAVCVINRVTGQQVAVWAGSAPPRDFAMLIACISLRYNRAYVGINREGRGHLITQDLLNIHGMPQRVFADEQQVYQHTGSTAKNRGFGIPVKRHLEHILSQLLVEFDAQEDRIVDAWTLQELVNFRVDSKTQKCSIEYGCILERGLARAIAGYTKVRLPDVKGMPSQTGAQQTGKMLQDLNAMLGGKTEAKPTHQSPWKGHTA